ncbi:hypothetical protein EVAR_8970_1 [Eumeta japonica]|uniref:MADF domain-containing protein n=1 Tax=Eumeta variegata TaxID=151549 RepID=A0A4C1WQC1_EUMVA|nr:hypothetical protein EVAR_8970_1 [Eumeta japonica]
MIAQIDRVSTTPDNRFTDMAKLPEELVFKEFRRSCSHYAGFGKNTEIENLIALVQERPVLWDKTEDDYKDKKLSLKAWHEVDLIRKLNLDELEEKEGRRWPDKISITLDTRHIIIASINRQHLRKISIWMSLWHNFIEMESRVTSKSIQRLESKFGSNRVRNRQRDRYLDRERQSDRLMRKMREFVPRPRGSSRCEN